MTISVLLNLLVVVIKASYTHVRLPFLLNLREGREKTVEMTVNLAEDLCLHVGLNFAQTLLHFALACFWVDIFAQPCPTSAVGGWLHIFSSA